MAINGKITLTTFTDQAKIQTKDDSLEIKAVHISELRTAIDKLKNYALNVDNCGIRDCCQGCQNTCLCQTNKCQSCQNVCTQCNSICEKCQDSCICQSSYCESCQDVCTQCACQKQCTRRHWDCQSH